MRMKRICLVGMSFLIFGMLAISGFAQVKETGVQKTDMLGIILGPVKVSFSKLSGYLPQLGGLVLILVFGALLAVGIAALLRWVLNLIHLEKGAKKVNIPEILKNAGIKLSLNGLITEIVFFLIILITLIVALEFYGLAADLLMSQIFFYIPHVIAAVFILILGILSAIFVSGIIMLVGGNMRITQSGILSNISKYAIIIFAGIVALKELGLWMIMTDRSKDIIFGGLVLGLALAFGLGAREKAGKFLNDIFKK